MSSAEENGPRKLDDVDARSMFSLQELDPSPVQEEFPDLENGMQTPDLHDLRPASLNRSPSNIPATNLGLRGYNWDSWLSALQKYSTYPPTLFLLLHFANTSLIPLATRSVPDSDTYLLLTRPVYQAPSLEHLVLTIPGLVHVASGIALRSIRSSRRARLYGVESRSQRSMLSFWPRVSLQAQLGYALVPLLGFHVLVNRVAPLIHDGGSSGVGLGYVAHAFTRNPVFWNAYYLALVAVGVWHIIGGWAAWMGWRVTTVRRERMHKKGSLEGYLKQPENEQRSRRQRKMWWTVNGLAAVGASIWLAGALGIVGRSEQGSGWEVNGWNEIYNRVPIIGSWL
ncbi:N2,N2-dimethylguanosine tRNA methyltransferase [Aspergillus steynii IBT 23096]|uniref:N2,N2-dimethylguanosine tRNA methyltransferase n=1 Tax=Aspergillus steynii IBT 23096 TaxID=1392250 RepID=A0A2I2FVL8_9EURO|nr:N2,N2-dimethylguanosine tRNA methyltransferase [Aspergillus steynii IBT 23096]PLB44664.1 N2,N2-dimethylguanosine tRNA methyltransferase [Aspergillus steynii IBT 23096]